MRKLLVSSFICLLSFSAAMAQKTITITNPTDLQRHEVVEISLTSHLSPLTSSICVRDAFGLAQPYQITHDGNLLIFASVRPKGQAVYTIEEDADGKPAPLDSRPYTFTKLYPERLDDIVIENDRTGFRFYGPAFQRIGSQGFGIDVWLKNSSELVIDSLYRYEFSRHPEIDSLRKAGNTREADSLTTLTSFHINHGMGMDCYNVGSTLGCGTPALLDGETLHMPWCYDTYRIIENGPMRLSVQLDFAPADKGDQHGVVEHRLVTLDRGSSFCRMTVWYDNLSHPTDVVGGLVIRDTNQETVVTGKNYIHYADPTGDAQKHNCQIYVATLYPEGIDDIRLLWMPEPVGGNAGHALGIRKSLGNHEPFTYYFGAAWSQSDVRSQREWQVRIEDFILCQQQPLILSETR